MAKRVAAKQLTMENFEQDDDDDYTEAEAGPQIASPDVLKNRPIARAKRRSELNMSSEEAKKAFGSFGGFKGQSFRAKTCTFALISIDVTFCLNVFV